MRKIQVVGLHGGVRKARTKKGGVGWRPCRPARRAAGKVTFGECLDDVADKRLRTREIGFPDQCRDQLAARADVRLEVLERFNARRDVGIIYGADIAAMFAAALFRGVKIPVAAIVILLADEATVDRKVRGEGCVQRALRQLGVEDLVAMIERLLVVATLAKTVARRTLRALLPLLRNWL